MNLLLVGRYLLRCYDGEMMGGLCDDEGDGDGHDDEGDVAVAIVVAVVIVVIWQLSYSVEMGPHYCYY